MRLLEKKNEERQEALDRTWALREAALKEREDELSRLRQEVEHFPQRIATEKEAVLAEATRQAASNYDQRILILQKDAEAERKVAELQVKTCKRP